MKEIKHYLQDKITDTDDKFNENEKISLFENIRYYIYSKIIKLI